MRYATGATLLYLVLWAAITFPQVRHMHDGVNDIGDPLLNTWALAWIAHQLPFAPAHLFDGNIFHPERRTLAYSETLIAPALAGAPLLWLGAEPILVYNLLLLAALVLSGTGTALLVREITGSGGAGLVAGAVFAFLPFRFDHYAHFQLQQTQWMPLALWALHRVADRPTARSAVALGGAVGLQALSSMYNTLFLGAFLAVVGAVLLAPWWRRPGTRVRALVLAVGIAGLLALPAALAHVRAQEVVGDRSREAALDGSAVWTDFLAAPQVSWLHGRWSAPYGRAEHKLFSGVLVTLLAVVALWPPWSRSRMAYAAGLLLAVDLARGMNGIVYPWLYEYVFAFRGLRVPARMAIMVGLGLAVLGGFGAARLLARLRSRGHRGVLVTALLAVVVAESWVGPLGLARIEGIPPTYADLLADKGESPRTSIIRGQRDPAPMVLLELPINAQDPLLMYYSTSHWQQLINGYSGFYSPRYIRLSEQLQAFPHEDALQALARLQTRYVTVHGELMAEDAYRARIAELDARPSRFRLVSRRPWQGREISLYRYTFYADE